MKKMITMFVGMALVVSCGTNPADDEQERKKFEYTDTADEADEGAMVTDSELAGQAITSQVDVAVSAIAEEPGTAAATTLSLWRHADGAGKFEKARTCVESEDTAIVEVTRSFSKTKEHQNRIMKVLNEVSITGSHKRTWSRDEKAVTCNENGKHAQIPLLERSGLLLAVEFSRSKSRDTTVEHVKRGTILRSFAFEAKGTRSIEWLDVAEGEDSIVLTKEIKSSVERKLQITNKKGEQREMERTVVTKEDAPLVVDISRDATTFKPETRTIKTGTLVATRKDDSRSETTFSNVVYKFGQCMPASGSISGEIFKAESTVADRTFTITFNGVDASIVFDDDEEEDYVPHGCDLEMEVGE